MPFATLPMYSAAPLRPAWQSLWESIARHLQHSGIDAEGALHWPDDFYAAWRDDDLILGQTCGWPLVSALGDDVIPFARFDFGLSDTPPGDYHSVFVAREGQPVEAPIALEPLFEDPKVRIAVNGRDSQSGFRVLGECVSAALALKYDRLIVTGSHAASIDAVAGGSAELAAIDAVTWQYALVHQPAARELDVVTRSRHVPGLPLVTAPRFADKLDTLHGALQSALDELAPDTRQMLGIKGLITAVRADYNILLDEPFGRVSQEVASP